MALPGTSCSQTAEAWGCRLAIDLLRACRATCRQVRVSGDNLAVVRFCAAQGRLRRPDMQAVIEPGLMRLCSEAWRVTWQAVRRRLNMAADSAATEAVFWAGRLRSTGDEGRRTRVRWFGVPPSGSDAGSTGTAAAAPAHGG